MADKPALESKDAVKSALPTSRSRPAGNPVFRMMGAFLRANRLDNILLIEPRITQLPLQDPLT